MRCIHHPLTEVIGYCCKCGAFGCATCMTRHEGELYCKKDYKPIAEKLSQSQRREQAISRPQRQRLVVHTKDGENLCGVSFSLNIRQSSFHLDMVGKHAEPLGETRQIFFRDLKAVYYVKSFDGKFDPETRFREMHEIGEAIVIDFNDGETMRGHKSRASRDDDPRFFVTPEDNSSNNISVLVERSAVKEIYSVEEFRRRRDVEIDAYLEKHKIQGYSKDELMGDWHFERSEYRRAYRQYAAARELEPDCGRLMSKMTSAQFNVGLQHIKQHDYVRAFSCMRSVLKLDPGHERAQEKAKKLRRYMKKKHMEQAQARGKV